MKIFFFIGILVLGTGAFAALPIDELYTLRLMNYANKEILAAPPLPHLYLFPLKYRIQMLYATSETEFKAERSADESANGNFKGEGDAGSFTLGIMDRLALYMLYFQHTATGDFSYHYQGADYQWYRDMEGKTATISPGLALTILGNDPQSVFTVNLFGGMAYSRFKSSLVTVVAPSNTVTSEYHTKSLLAGAQLGIVLGPLLFNPYFLIFQELGADKCRPVTYSDGTQFASTDGCSGNNKISVNSDFSAYGISASIPRLMGLSVGLYAKATQKEKLASSNVKIIKIGLSFGN
jgi:hypothetical protein